MPLCHFCQMVPSHCCIWSSRISRVLDLTINILPAHICCKCKGRIEKLEKACVELAAFGEQNTRLARSPSVVRNYFCIMSLVPEEMINAFTPESLDLIYH